MDLDSLKRKIQNHFTDGLAVVVGSGLSAAEGIPGMWDLGQHLLREIPPHVTSPSTSVWKAIEDDLRNNVDLETTLLRNQPDELLESSIMKTTARYLLDFERAIFQDVFCNGRKLRFTRLLEVLSKETSGIPVITTNYDRLIELATEQAGIGIDSSFVGHRHGVFDANGSRMSLCRDGKINKQTRSFQKIFSPHIRLLKPHGSFDWYYTTKGPIRCSIDIDGERLIITPGRNKYLRGYDRPFDHHISKSNDAIDKGSRFLIVGYGFNDDHLQTHLTPRLENGDPAIVLTRSLSDKAAALLPSCRGTIAITREKGGNGTLVLTHDGQFHFPSINIWDVSEFVCEVWNK